MLMRLTKIGWELERVLRLHGRTVVGMIIKGDASFAKTTFGWLLIEGTDKLLLPNEVLLLQGLLLMHRLLLHRELLPNIVLLGLLLNVLLQMLLPRLLLQLLLLPGCGNVVVLRCNRLLHSCHSWMLC